MESERSTARAQIILTVFGLVMLALSWVGFVAGTTADTTSPPTAAQGSRLQVAPSNGVAPRSVIDQLQGASTLQGQGTQGLQQPVGEQLQPNAKTDNLNGTRPVQ